MPKYIAKRLTLESSSAASISSRRQNGEGLRLWIANNNAIAVSDGNKVFVVNDEFKVLGELFNLNDYKNYNIKPYFKYGKDDIVYMIFSFIKDGKEESQIKFNLKTLKIEE